MKKERRGEERERDRTTREESRDGRRSSEPSQAGGSDVVAVIEEGEVREMSVGAV